MTPELKPRWKKKMEENLNSDQAERMINAVWIAIYILCAILGLLVVIGWDISAIAEIMKKAS